ncbi:hypothetical protein HanPSC8_Chr10g0432861 [Helianthus annuus]|nr:hypothetical protein HanPSC8_Chr10g0432861 [Helianthus annuus]
MLHIGDSTDLEIEVIFYNYVVKHQIINSRYPPDNCITAVACG